MQAQWTQDRDAICRAVARDLVALCASGTQGDSDGSHLILPVIRAGRPRVSEQESRVLFFRALEKHGWYYSVETPTLQTYVQSGERPLSARLNLTVYSARNPLARLVNIELRAHNPHEESLRKDLEKLVREEIYGLWFHTVLNTNRGTLPSLFGKFRRALDRLDAHVGGKPRQIDFAICCLTDRRLVQATLPLGEGRPWAEAVGRLFSSPQSEGWSHLPVA